MWDELLSPRVPPALRSLGFRTTYVGNEEDGTPARQSSDEDVIAFAKQTNQIIVTSNHDMMMICAEAEQRFVWLDPRGKQLSAREQVLLVFSQIERWEELLAENPSDCVHALRTKCEPISPGDAVRLARRRMRELQRRRRSRAPRPLGPLFDSDT